MNRYPFLFLALAAMFLLGGCATEQIPRELQYAPPTSGAVAKIKGSEQKSVFLANFTVLILNIDGKRVMTDHPDWSTPLAVTAGHHQVTAQFTRGAFFATANLEWDAVANATYEIKFTTNLNFLTGGGPDTHVNFWIINSTTGKPVSGIVQSHIGGGSGGTFVPIIIPAS